MLAPNVVSPGSHPRNAAAVSRASATSASLRRLLPNGPPRFAFDSRRYPEIASITESGHCVPPGPSKKARRPSQRGEARADGIDVEGDSGHGVDTTLWPVSTLAPPKERLDRGDRSALGRAWRVIVLNDDHNTFDGVAFALSSVLPGVDFDAGMRLANRIHDTGQAIVWSGDREHAELYWEQLRDRGLTMAPLET